MKKRLKELIESEKLSTRKFAERIEENNTTIQNILTRGSSPGAIILASIARAFPKLNMRWLLLGEGTIWKSELEKELDKLKLQVDTLNEIIVDLKAKK